MLHINTVRASNTEERLQSMLIKRISTNCANAPKWKHDKLQMSVFLWILESFVVSFSFSVVLHTCNIESYLLHQIFRNFIFRLVVHLILVACTSFFLAQTQCKNISIFCYTSQPCDTLSQESHCDFISLVTKPWRDFYFTKKMSLSKKQDNIFLE